MSHEMNLFVSVWMKMFFIFTPFLIVSLFLGMTQGQPERRRRAIAVRITIAVAVLCFAVFFFGAPIFALFGITLDAFRIGAGTLLMLSAIDLVRSKTRVEPAGPDEDIALVPMGTPIIVGPAVVGTLFVFSADMAGVVEKTVGCAALALAILMLGALLFVASMVERILGERNLQVISKFSGLILAAMAAQMIGTGLRHCLFPAAS